MTAQASNEWKKVILYVLFVVGVTKDDFILSLDCILVHILLIFLQSTYTFV